MLDLESLRCFVAAAHHLNFRKAAQEVHLTPAAFGQRIKTLEEGLGVALFERSTRSVSLTEQGRRLLPTAQEALLAARRCEEVVHDELQPVSLTLGTRFELGISWVVPALIEAMEVLPHVHVDLYFGSGPDILARLDAHQVDAIITSAPAASRQWESAFLHREDYVFVGQTAMVTRRPLLGPEDARLHTLLDVDASLPLARYLMSVVEAPLEFADMRACGAGEAVKRFVMAGVGVGVLPEYMVREQLNSGVLTVLMPHVPLLSDTFRLIYSPALASSSACRQLAEFLRGRPLG